MSMVVEYETSAYSWLYDGLHGVGRFVRKSDEMMTFMETGQDCQDVRRQFRRLQQKTSSPRYPSAAPSFDAIFNSIASEYFVGADKWARLI